MAEANTAEVEAKVDAAFGAAFGADDTPPAPAAKVVEAPEPAPVVAPVPVVVPEKPQYVRVTKQEWDNTKAATGKVASLESQLAKLTGNAPNADRIVQQVIDKVLDNVRSQTSAGAQIDPQVLMEAFAEQEKDFPELAAQNRKAIEHVLKNLRGSVPAQSPAQPVDEATEFEKFEKWQLVKETKALAETYPDWSEIVGRPLIDGDPPAEGNAFRVWLNAQPAAYQEKLNQTKSPAMVQAAIEKFKAQPVSVSPSPRSDRAAARRAVIEDAVTPRADGNPPPLNSPQTAEEAFGNAFKRAKSR